MAKADMLESFNFLKKQAFELGAEDAKIISVKKIVIEDRVVFKCQLRLRKIRQDFSLSPLRSNS